MFSDFVILIRREYSELSRHDYSGAVVGPHPEFEFVESGPWSLYDVCTQRQHRVTYLMPSTIDFGGSYEPPMKTVRRCLQSIAPFPIRVEPALESTLLPAMLAFHSGTTASVQSTRVRCLCSFGHDIASTSADVKALLYDGAELERHFLSALHDIPRPKAGTIRGLREQYEAAALSVVLDVGMVLPCETVCGASRCYAACVLVEQCGVDEFLCDVYLERPTEVRPGTKFVRRVSCKRRKGSEAVEFFSEVANVLEMSGQA